MRQEPILRNRAKLCALSAALAVVAAAGQPPLAQAQNAPLGEREAHALAVESYLYFYPLVTMDLTRRQMTNIPAG
jgi:hypothetical protein